MRYEKPMRPSFDDDVLVIADFFRGLLAAGFNRHDLIIIAMYNERGHCYVW